MKQLTLEYYTGSKNIRKSKVVSEMDEQCVDDDLEKFDSAYDVEASQQTDIEVEVLEGVMYID